MDELAIRLKEARSNRAMTLETATEAARISPAYLHKLEAGRVQTPSPHVLRRLAAVLEVPYLELMTLAGYLGPSDSATTAEEATQRGHAKRSRAMKQPQASRGPTNAEIVRLLQAVQTQLSELKRGQDDLAKQLAKSVSHKSSG